jgi:hypothetical protein
MRLHISALRVFGNHVIHRPYQHQDDYRYAQEKAQDKKIFEAAKAEGKSAALLEDNADDVWTTSVGNVPAGAVVAIVLNMGFRLRRSI